MKLSAVLHLSSQRIHIKKNKNKEKVVTKENSILYQTFKVTKAKGIITSINLLHLIALLNELPPFSCLWLFLWSSKNELIIWQSPGQKGKRIFVISNETMFDLLTCTRHKAKRNKVVTRRFGVTKDLLLFVLKYEYVAAKGLRAHEKLVKSSWHQWLEELINWLHFAKRKN